MIVSLARMSRPDSIRSPVMEYVRIRSTLSPGSSRPLTPETSLTGIEIARLPSDRTAARKPRSPGWTVADLAIGTPTGRG